MFVYFVYDLLLIYYEMKWNEKKENLMTKNEHLLFNCYRVYNHAIYFEKKKKKRILSI